MERSFFYHRRAVPEQSEARLTRPRRQTACQARLPATPPFVDWKSLQRGLPERRCRPRVIVHAVTLTTQHTEYIPGRRQPAPSSRRHSRAGSTRETVPSLPTAGRVGRQHQARVPITSWTWQQPYYPLIHQWSQSSRFCSSDPSQRGHLLSLQGRRRSR